MADEYDDDTLDELSEKITSISISAYAKEKVKRSRQITARFCCGYLTGRIKECSINIYDLIELDLTLFENFDPASGQSNEIQAEFAAIRASIPVGIDIVGVFITQPENGNLEVAEHLIKILKQIEDICLYTDLEYAVCLIKPKVCLWHVYSPEYGLQTITEAIECADDLSKELLFRIQKVVDVSCMIFSRDETIVNELDLTCSISSKSAFLINEMRTIMFDKDDGEIVPMLSGVDIINEVKKVRDIKSWPVNNKPLSNVIDVSALIRITSDSSGVNEDSVDSQCNVPVLLSKRLSGECITLKVNIDTLVLVSPSTSTQRLLFMFRDAVFRQCNALNLLMKIGTKNKFYKPFHFLLSPKSLFPVTALIPCVDLNGEILLEDSVIEYRESLHQRFLLLDDRPFFRHSQALFSERKFSNFHLINPHEGLSTPNVNDGKVALVQGKYAYHHYMQDGFDDNGWGCAYRSLQTLASWLWLQGYTEKKYPSHKEIQEALVALGDKEKSFVGSKEWIGSMEVSYCLDHIYGIQSKTLYVSTGADLAFKGRELYQHFIDQGTPVMIGGGVLAHTIVGVIYNEQTGEIRFLIVDPHFTGSDNLKTIINKSWVSWKGPDFWNQTAHYNMCLPQRPAGL